MTTVFLSLFFGLAVAAQDYRGEAIPKINHPDPIEFSRLRFLTFTFGHEGPMDMPLPTPPVSGREYFVEADILGMETVATIRFEFVDTTGRTVQTLNMWTDSSTDGEFYGFVTVPSQPFRTAISGTTIDGTPFRAIDGAMVHPLASGTAEDSRQLPGTEAMVAAYRQQMKARFDQAKLDHPDGIIRIGRATVSRIAYEPLHSASGMTIGMRLRYSIRFPSRQTINVIPHVFPAYPTSEWRSMVTMKPLSGTITPTPQMVGVQSLQDVVIYGADATYEAGVYNVTIDLIPDYVFQGTQTRRFCLHEQKFSNRPAWNALIGSAAPIPYSVSIIDTETRATIPSFFPQHMFYEAFRADGAFDCGPTPNIRF